MEPLLEQIRHALLPDATPELRATAAQACRIVLAALEADEAAPATAAPSSPLPMDAMRAAVSALRGMPVDQLLDLAITRLKAAVPASEAAPVPGGVKFQLLHVSTKR